MPALAVFMATEIMSFRTIWQALKHAIWGFIDDDVFTLAAALAFYAMLSVAPLLVLMTTVLGFLSDTIQERITEQVRSLVGPDAGKGVKMLLEHAQATQLEATISAIIGLGVVLVTATTVFARLQYSLNLIFDVRTRQHFVVGWIYKRFVSLAMVFGMGVVLVASVVISSVTVVLFAGRGPLLLAANLLSSLVVYTLIFVIMFKVLPDIRISWEDTWVGGALTAVLFLAGEYAISLYFSRAAVSTVYGAAGSLVVLLLWVFYSAVIVFLGAELTQAYGACCGDKIVPNNLAEWDTHAPRAHRKSLMDERDRGRHRG